MSVGPDTLVTAVATFVAALTGAGLAFLLSWQASKRLETERRVAAINYAILVLFRQRNLLENIRHKTLNTYRDLPGRQLIMPTIQLLDYSDWRIDARPLSFLLNSELNEILVRVLLVEEHFHTALKSIHLRTDFVRQWVDPKKEAAGIGHGDTLTVADLEEAIGPGLTAGLKGLTDSMYEHVDSASDALLGTAQEFARKIKVRYPKHRFMFPTPARGEARG